MADPIEFWFDFSSPYGYLAAQRIDAIAEKHGRSVDWCPFLLGVTFQVTGSRPLMETPLKGDYLRHDMERYCRRKGVPLVEPPKLPFMSVSAARAVHWMKQQSPERAGKLAKALYDRAFGEGGDISGAAGVIEVAGRLGIDTEELAAALKDPKVKDRLRAEVERSKEKGVFGSPFVFVDGEGFWGNDRLDEVDDWLATGGW